MAHGSAEGKSAQREAFPRDAQGWLGGAWQGLASLNCQPGQARASVPDLWRYPILALRRGSIGHKLSTPQSCPRCLDSC